MYGFELARLRSLVRRNLVTNPYSSNFATVIVVNAA